MRDSRWREHPTVAVQSTFYDSHDWRLYQRGESLVLERYAAQDAKLIWRSLTGISDRSRSTSLVISTLPNNSAELPPGEFRDKLGKVLKLRALLPFATLHHQRHHLERLNSDEKIVVRLHIDESSLTATTSTSPDLHRVYVRPVKGYQRPYAKVIKRLRQDFNLTVPSTDLLSACLQHTDRHPGDYSSKFTLALDPQLPATTATQSILQHLQMMLRSNEPGAKEALDTEFLHDFRVAVRRTRSVLSQLDTEIQPAILTRYRPSFAWLGQITSPMRDLDVYLLKFGDYQAHLPAAVQSDLQPLFEHLQKAQRREQQKLVKQLSSKRYHKLQHDWHSAINTLWPSDDDTAIINVANAKVLRAYRRVLRRGRAIQPDTPVEALHDLRKLCKKLRYLLEFFHSLYDAEAIAAFIKVLKQLQENLGDVQDLAVHSDTLQHYSVELNTESSTTLIAMGRLVAELDHQQRQARIDFAERFQAFDQPRHRRRFNKLLKTPPQETR